MILQATYQMRSEMRSIFATATRSWVEIAAVSWTNEFSDPCAGHAQKRRWVSSTPISLRFGWQTCSCYP